MGLLKLMSTGQVETSLAKLKVLLQNDPTNGDLYLNLAKIYHGHYLRNESSIGSLKNCFKCSLLAFLFSPENVANIQLAESTFAKLVSRMEKEDLLELTQKVKKIAPRSLLMVSSFGSSPLAELFQSKTRTTVISGFLGSGKTTLINKLLDLNLRTCVIVNDMSEINIDEKLIKHKKPELNLVALTNGCICCTLKDELFNQIAQLYANNVLDSVDYLLIESSGVSEPLPVAQTLTLRDKFGRSLRNILDLDAFISVIEYSAIEKTINGEGSIYEIVRDQILFADVIIISKCDLLADNPNRKLQELSSFTRSLNTTCRIHFSFDGDLKDEMFSPKDISYLVETNLFYIERYECTPEWKKELSTEHVSEIEKYGLSSFAFSPPRTISADISSKFNIFAQELKKYNVVRAKGTMLSDTGSYVFDFSGDESSLKLMESEIKASSELIFIGPQLKVSELEKNLKEFFFI
eukprot:augustus_masked-scaffold_7-processed-gene-18.4-mRNA-1 protein AED:0.36 eAED:0.37 QI:0/-1/0/1/-1/1/1/0/463